MSAPIDPAFDTPFVDYGQVGSFVAPVAVPSLGPLDGTLVNLPCINPDWLRLVLGCVDQLRNRSSWLGSYTDAQIVAILGLVEQLRIALQMANPCCDVALQLTSGCVLQYSTDGGVTFTDVAGWATNFPLCVQAVIIPPVPVLPPGQTNPQRACNIAGFLAIDLVQQAVQQAIVVFNQNKTLVNYITTILPIFSYAFPITTFGLEAFVFLYNFITSANIADFEASQNDVALFNLVKCAIYEAILPQGYVTPGNKGTICSNIGAIVYTHPDVITAISGFCDGLSVAQLQAMQNVGVYNDPQDCTACGAPTNCHLFDFTTGPAGWGVDHPYWGNQVNGQGWEGVYDGVDNLTIINIDITFSPPLVIDGWKAKIGLAGVLAPGYVRDVQMFSSGSLVYTESMNSTSYPSGSIIGNNTPFSVTADEVRLRVYDIGNVSDVITSFELMFPSGDPIVPHVGCTY